MGDVTGRRGRTEQVGRGESRRYSIEPAERVVVRGRCDRSSVVASGVMPRSHAAMVAADAAPRPMPVHTTIEPSGSYVTSSVGLMTPSPPSLLHNNGTVQTEISLISTGPAPRPLTNTCTVVAVGSIPVLG